MHFLKPYFLTTNTVIAVLEHCYRSWDGVPDENRLALYIEATYGETVVPEPC
jgi:hypothetical protein